jgi:hypothetical protein
VKADSLVQPWRRESGREVKFCAAARLIEVRAVQDAKVRAPREVREEGTDAMAAIPEFSNAESPMVRRLIASDRSRDANRRLF